MDTQYPTVLTFRIITCHIIIIHMISDPTVFTGGDSGPKESRANAWRVLTGTVLGEPLPSDGWRPSHTSPTTKRNPTQKVQCSSWETLVHHYTEPTRFSPLPPDIWSPLPGPLHPTPPTASDQLRVIFRVSPKKSLPWRPSLTSKFVLCRIYVKPLPVSTYDTAWRVPCWPAPDRGQREDSTRLYREHCDIPSDIPQNTSLEWMNKWKHTCTSQVHWETVSQSNLTETKTSELTELG